MGRLRLLLAASLCAVLAGAGCSSSDDDPPDADPRSSSSSAAAARLEPECPAPTMPGEVSADVVNKVVSSSDLPAWQAGDIGASARLRDHRLVWVFGDTIRTSAFDPRIVANSMLISSGRCVSQLRTPDDGPVIPDVSPGVVRWPMSIVVLDPPAEAPSGVEEVLVVLCARTQRRGGDGGSLDFVFRGTSAAVFTVSADGVPRLHEVVEITPDDDAVDQVNWGAAATVQGEWYYVYGTRLTGDPGTFGRELYASRASAADPGNREKWEFWDGTRWQSDRERAAPILPAVGGVSQTLSVDVVDGEFVAVSKRDGDLGDFVYTWTSSTPVGPWQPHQGVPAPSGFDTGQLEYAPLAHPEIPLTDGHLLVSVSRNTTDITQLMEDPEVGRPLFVEVSLP